MCRRHPQGVETMNLSIIIPAYNEEEKIIACLEKVTVYCREALSDWQVEIIVVNDGSSDRTLELVQQFARNKDWVRVVSYSQNRGKGYAVNRGVKEARGKHILFMDVDLATPIEEFDKFLPKLKADCDVIIGTRRVKASELELRQPFYRELMGKVFYYLSSMFLGLSVSDITCGFKVFSMTAAKKVFANQQLWDWSFDAEILFLAQLYGFKICEVPVRWRDDPDSRVRVIRDALRALQGLWQIRKNYWKGRYKQI